VLNIRLELKGTTPLVVHNERLANPDDEFVKQIREYTKKRVKTEEDRKAIMRLEWFGGLYLAPDIEGPAFPTRCLRRCLIEAGTITKQGKQVQRGLSFTELDVPLAYQGPRDPKELEPRPSFRDVRSVGIGASRTMRCRPQFIGWSLSAIGLLLEDVLDLDDLKRIADRAGLAVGLCEMRTLGMGRFTAEVIVE